MRLGSTATDPKWPHIDVKGKPVEWTFSEVPDDEMSVMCKIDSSSLDGSCACIVCGRNASTGLYGVHTNFDCWVQFFLERVCCWGCPTGQILIRESFKRTIRDLMRRGNGLLKRNVLYRTGNTLGFLDMPTWTLQTHLSSVADAIRQWRTCKITPQATGRFTMNLMENSSNQQHTLYNAHKPAKLN